MTEQNQTSLEEIDSPISKLIRDLETGSEYPYKDIRNAVSILRRIAHTDRCPIGNVLETVWIEGCDSDELKRIIAQARNT